MKFRQLAAASLAAFLVASSAVADTYSGKDSNGTVVLFNGKLAGGNFNPASLLVDQTGAAFGTATNGLFVNPATGATFPVSGSISVSNFPTAFSVAPSASGGFSHLSLIYAGLVGTPQYPKTSAGQVVRVQCDNIAGTSAAYVQIFDAASGATLGTSVVDYIPLPAGGTGGFTLAGAGVQFTNGIGLAAATAPTGTVAVAANTVNCSVTIK